MGSNTDYSCTFVSSMELQLANKWAPPQLLCDCHQAGQDSPGPWTSWVTQEMRDSPPLSVSNSNQDLLLLRKKWSCRT